MLTSQANCSYGGVEGRSYLKPNGGATAALSSIRRVEGRSYSKPNGGAAAGPLSVRQVERRNYLKPNGGAAAEPSSLRLRPYNHHGIMKNSKAPINSSNANAPNIISPSSIRLRPPTHQGAPKNLKAPITTSKSAAEDKSSRKSTAEEKALKAAKKDAAKKSHKDAERRRRERINNNLGALRTMVLGNTTKTDKASLLTTVVKRVKELKKKAADAIHAIHRGGATGTENLQWAIPSENDEIALEYINYSDEAPRTTYTTEEAENEGERSPKKKKLKKSNPVETKTRARLIKVTFNCEDRVDLLKDLNRAIKNVKAKVIKAEMSTVGGRMKGIFVIQTGCGLGILNEIMVGGGSGNVGMVDEIGTMRRALKAVIEKATRMSDYGHHQRRFNHYY